ncbi:MAG TPA: flagellar hook-basal body complex protein FliE [Steroidobacteraceae bacterium]|nr:flagellar hook-basal body complex protein FliE [Steroidobacteraceae bacterium]
MSIEAIAALSSAAATDPLASAVVRPENNAFSGILDQLSGLNAQMQKSEADVQALALGKTDNLHQVMIGMEQTRLQFDLLLQVRNKVLDAYQEMMRMQV